MEGVQDVAGSRVIAELAGVDQRTARRWLASGKLPLLPRPPGAHRKVSLAALRARLVAIASEREVDDIDGD